MTNDTARLTLVENRPFYALDYAMMMGALTILSFSPIVVRYAQHEGVPTLLIAGGRMLLAALIITPLIIYRHRAEIARLSLRDAGMAAMTGIWMGLNGILVMLSLEHTSILTNQVIASTSPVWVALLEVLVLKAKLPPAIWVGLALVLLGGLVVGYSGLQSDDSSGSSGSLYGDGLALVSAMCGGVYLILGRSVRRKVTLLPYIWIVYGCGGLLSLLTLLIVGIPYRGYSTAGYGWIVVSAVIVQLFGFSGMGYALAYLPATMVAIAGRAVVFGAGIFAFVIFAEVPAPLQLVGSIVILSGVLIAVLGRENDSRTGAAESS